MVSATIQVRMGGLCGIAMSAACVVYNANDNSINSLELRVVICSTLARQVVPKTNQMIFLSSGYVSIIPLDG